MRRSGGFSPSLMTASHSLIDVASDDVPAGSLVIGNVFDDPDLAEQFGFSEDDLGFDDEDIEDEDLDEDYGARLGYRSRTVDPYVTMPTAMLSERRRPSRTAVRRMQGQPGVFVSGAVGALFVDTDGRRVQHGDDF